MTLGMFLKEPELFKHIPEILRIGGQTIGGHWKRREFGDLISDFILDGFPPTPAVWYQATSYVKRKIERERLW